MNWTSVADQLLLRFRAAGVLEPLDHHFARTLGRLASEQDPGVLLGAALASRAPGRGHLCVELGRVAQQVRLERLDREQLRGLPWPEVTVWRDALQRSPLVRLVPSGLPPTPEAEVRPLVLQRDRLYLQRYWQYEERLAAQLTMRLAAPAAEEIDLPLLREGLRRYFPPQFKPIALPDRIDRQQLAAIAAVVRRAVVVTGGPGTGKTSTVKRILLLLLEQARLAWQQGRLTRFPPRLALAAPTGKAAARLKEAIREDLDPSAGDPALREHLPTEASTVHRLLGVVRATPTRFFHGRNNPLPVDCLVVDEASMIDFALMTKLVEAVPPQARLILLGDRDQLASVEAGAVLEDICQGGEAGYSSGFISLVAELLGGAGPSGGIALAAWPADAPVATEPALAPQLVGAGRDAAADPAVGAGLQDSLIRLLHPYRFGPDSGIGAVARAINRNDPAAVLAYLRQEATEAGSERDAYPDAELIEAEPDALWPRLAGLVLDGVTPWIEAAVGRRDPQAALLLLGRFRVLAAHRQGRLGVEGLNREIEGLLTERGFIRPEQLQYPGRPILITQNDPLLRLFNGDTGILVETGAGGLRACFLEPDGRSVRTLHPGRLPPHETVYAMTVHKSQGSQFDQVLVVLPEYPSPVLTRELLYTAVTRAKERMVLAGREPIIRRAIQEQVQRFSGLREKLWGA